MTIGSTDFHFFFIWAILSLKLSFFEFRRDCISSIGYSLSIGTMLGLPFQMDGHVVRTSVRNCPGYFLCRSRTAAVMTMTSPGAKLLNKMSFRNVPSFFYLSTEWAIVFSRPLIIVIKIKLLLQYHSTSRSTKPPFVLNVVRRIIRLLFCDSRRCF